MNDTEANRNGHGRLRVSAIILTSALFGAIGVFSVCRQVTSRTVEAGFAVVDAGGRIEVKPGESADQAGLRTGDRLIALGGSPMVDPFGWNRELLGAVRAGRLPVTIQREDQELHLDVPVFERRGADPIYYYLTLVGFCFLATATLAGLRPGGSGLTWRYFRFAVSVFCVLAISDTAAGATADWVLFLVDRLGRLSFPCLFILFASALARTDGRGRWVSLLLWVPPAALGAASLAIYSGASRGLLRDPLALWTIKDRAELFVASAYLLFGLGILGRAAKREALAPRRYQVRWAFGGAAIGFGPLVLFYLLPLSLGARPPVWAEFSALTTAVLPLTLSSALFRYKPGDLEIYLKRAIGALSVVFFTFAVCSAAWVLIDRIGRSVLNLSDWAVAGVAALIGAILYPKIRQITHQAIDRIVYGGRYSFRRTLVAFGRELNAELELDSLVAKFQTRTRETLDLTSTLLLVRHDRERVLRPVGAAEPVVPVDSPLVERIRTVSYLLLEDLAHAPGGGRFEPLRGLGVHYLFPMKVKGEVRAVLATGPRRGGQPLSSEDVELLVALCGHAAVALESARLLAQLQGKVNEVERLRRHNEDILESSRIGILVVDADGTIQALNEALIELYGASREEAVGRTLAEVFPLPLVRRLARAAEGDEERDGIRRLYRYTLSDRRGRKIVVNVSKSNLAAGDGQRSGQVITIDDVTEQVKMEEQLLRQDRLASIGILASGVAHEVNTPLTGISSYTQMLLAELDPADPRYEVLRKIERQTFRAANIVNSLLNFTREGTGAVEMIGVQGLLDESLALFEPQLRGGAIRIERVVEGGLPQLPGHRGKLQQVLLNLLLNARDAIPGSGTIRTSARRREGRLLIEVADDGEGIPEEDLGKVFDPFFTTKPRGRGTGLGLSLSYNIVHEHKGEISVESRRGEGTVFTVDLPLERRDAARA